LDPAEKLADSLTQFMKFRMVNAGGQSEPKDPWTLSSNYTFYCNLDRMLSGLPRTVVEDLNMEMSKMVYAEMKKHEPEVVVHLQPI